jgi:hypothetical protein
MTLSWVFSNLIFQASLPHSLPLPTYMDMKKHINFTTTSFHDFLGVKVHILATKEKGLPEVERLFF